MAGRRRFGRVRKLPSGRWQPRYSTPDRREHPAADTFATKTAAERWLASVETDLARGQWVDPRSRQLLLSGYAGSWLAARPDLKIRTRELYQWLLEKYVVPQLGHLPVDKITPSVVRSWHAGLLRDAVAAWSGARWGELVALSPDRLDLEHGTMTIDRQYVELRNGTVVLETPKSAAGVRTVHIPPHLLPELSEHLVRYTTPRSSVVFPNSKDEPIRRASFRSVWLLARRRPGLPELRFHDLRHAGNTLAAATGASTKELMARMGHASMRAALIYQHATTDRDAAIAVALSRLAQGDVAAAERADQDRPPLRARGRARARATGT